MRLCEQCNSVAGQGELNEARIWFTNTRTAYHLVTLNLYMDTRQLNTCKEDKKNFILLYLLITWTECKQLV